MNKVATTLFAGLIILTPAPILAEDLSYFPASEVAPIAQANGFEVQEVRFRGGRGLRRGGFRRSRFRRGGFRRHGSRRSKFRRDPFKHRGRDKFHEFKKFEHFDEHPDILKKKKFFR